MSVRKFIASLSAQAYAAFPKRLRRMMVFFDGALIYTTPAAEETRDLLQEQGNMEEIIKDDLDFMAKEPASGFSHYVFDGKRLVRKVVMSRTGTKLFDIWGTLHEWGHWCVPGAYLGGTSPAYKERCADAFAALLFAKLFPKQRHFLLKEERHSVVSLVEHGDREHYSGDTIAAVRELVQVKDMSQIPEADIAHIAADIADATEVPQPTIDKLVAAFAPLRAAKKSVRERVETKKFANDFAAVVVRHAQDKDVCLAATRFVFFAEHKLQPTPALKKALKTLGLTY